MTSMSPSAHHGHARRAASKPDPEPFRAQDHEISLPTLFDVNEAA